MRKSLSVIFASLLVIGGLSATTSFAQTKNNHRRNVNQRQENQQDRIAQGIRSGELTPREAARLERGETRINRTERRYRQSGDGLSPQERARLNRDLNRESRRIHAQRNDGQNQPHLN